MSQNLQIAPVASITDLYDSYRDKFIRMVQSRFELDEIDAEEIFSLAVTIVWEKINTGTLPELKRGLKEYCFGVGKFVARKFIRDRNKYRYDPDHLLREHILETTQVEDKEQFEADMEVARLALDKIGDPCRKLLEFFYLKEMDMESIGQALNYANAESTRSQKCKCLKKFREIFFEIYGTV